MTGCGGVPIPDSLRQCPRKRIFLGSEKRGQLVLNSVKRLQRRGNDQTPSFMHPCIASHPIPAISVAAPG